MTRDVLAFIVDNTVATECKQLDSLLHDGDAGFVGIGLDFVGYGPMRYVASNGDLGFCGRRWKEPTLKRLPDWTEDRGRTS